MLRVLLVNPWQREVSSRYGAPMGRRCDPQNFSGRLKLQKVPLRGDYDQGGAYWGGGPGTLPLWCAWSEDGSAMYVRAESRALAIAAVRLAAGDAVSFHGEGRQK